MKVKQTCLADCLEIINDVKSDHRGYFFESFNINKFKKVAGFSIDFVQDNQSFSKKGVLRGLHYQSPPYEQAKLVRVLQGEIMDVVVDLRKESDTFGKKYTVILNKENKKQLFVPRGFAHGFIALKDSIFLYKCDNFYNPNSENGINYKDPFLSIDWKLNENEIIISEKDKHLPFLKL